MSLVRPTLRPLSCWKSITRRPRCQREARLLLSTTPACSTRPSPPPRLPAALESSTSTTPKKIKTYPPPPSLAAKLPKKDPIAHLTAVQLATLDPTGARTALFARESREAANVGDILLVRLRNGDPFAGVCLNIRRRGVDTGILLRNQLTRVGVEMWFKVYSPNVEAVEIVQRKARRARRARLYYMRKPEHDMGSVQGILQQYLRKRAMLRSGEARGRDATLNKKGGKPR